MISESDVERNETPRSRSSRVQLDRVDQVPVVGQRQLPPVGPPHRLGVLPRVRAGGRVPHVADRHVPLQGTQPLLVEHLRDQPLVAHRHDVAALRGRDPGRLLATVLEREQREVGEPRDLVPGGTDPEDAALVARPVTEVGER